METLARMITQWTGLSPAAQSGLFETFVILLVVWLAHALVVRLVYRRTEDPQIRYRWRKGSGYVATVVALLLVARIWFVGFGSVATYLGLLSAGLTIALSDIVANLAGWVFIAVRAPFRLGDRIEIDGHAGDVIDIRALQFSIMEIGNWVAADQSTGRVLHVPNGRVLREPLANYSAGFPYIWSELPVLLTFESAWRDAKKILLRIVVEETANVTGDAQDHIRKASKRYAIRYRHLTPTVYTRVEESGVLLTLRYLCEIRRRRGAEQALWEAILEAFAQRDDIDFAYPTQRWYDNPREGKPGVGSQ